MVIGTRFWGKTKDADKRWLEISTFCEKAGQVGRVVVAINTAADEINTLGRLAHNFPAVKTLSVTPWGRFVPALNAIVGEATLYPEKQLLLASVGFPPSANQVETLSSHLHDDTLVVGARFNNHDFHPGQTVDGLGARVPWNTFALWNMQHLAKFGFPLTGEVLFDPENTGVEEVSTIAIYQKIYPVLKAKLVDITGFAGNWDQTSWDAEKRDRHREKIQSKNNRPAAQMSALSIPYPRIMHIS